MGSTASVPDRVDRATASALAGANWDDGAAGMFDSLASAEGVDGVAAVSKKQFRAAEEHALAKSAVMFRPMLVALLREPGVAPMSAERIDETLRRHCGRAQ